MKRRQDGWVSEYRRQKFLERQKKPFKDLEIHYLAPPLLKMPTTIAVMLDLDGTINGINDEKASAFVKQLDYIRQKFKAEEGFISISTHYDNSSKIKENLDILARNLSSTIKIGMSFYYGGTYDYEKNCDTACGMRFNHDKVETFTSYYVHDISQRNSWFAIIDDGIEDDVYLKYQNWHPMVVCRPSQSEECVSKNHFMRRASTEFGFDGVLEAMDSYIESITPLSPIQILDTQRNMIMHLSSFQLIEKIRGRDYAFLERYFLEGYADEEDYQDTLSWLLLTNSNACPSKEELIYLQRILEFMITHFQENENEQGIERSFQLKKTFGLHGESIQN